MVGFGAAAMGPFAFYVATSSAFAYWLDGGEFVAASTELGISHPPGHPLAALVGAFFTALPIGPLAFRVAVASASMAALACGALYLAMETTVRAMGVVSSRVSVPLAVGGAWVTAASYGFWFQAVRPEVYALEAALLFFALERIVALEAAWPTVNIKPLYVAAFTTGLGLANHHFLTFLLLPAVAPTLARVHGARGARPVLLSVALGLAGLVTYAYLPLRAAAGPNLNLGAPTDASRLFWVVSAEAFQKNTGGGVPQPLDERFLDVGVQVVSGLGWFTVGLALLGFYVLMRTRGARRVGTVWALVLVVFVPARAWLGFVRSNPDAAGYLMPVFGALVAFAVAFLAALLVALDRAPRPRPSVLAMGVAWAAVVLGAAQAYHTLPLASLATFADTDAVDDVTLRRLPPRAVLFAYDPQTAFRAYQLAADERSQPDTLVVPVPFLTYPGMVDALLARVPSLKGALRSFLLEGELNTGELATLALERPVLVELDVRVPARSFRTLAPEGLYYRALSSDALDDDRALGARTQDAAWAALERRLPRNRDVETSNRLLWRSYVDALFHAATGDRDRARRALVRAMAINPQAKELLALDQALETTEGSGKLDIGPFLPQVDGP